MRRIREAFKLLREQVSPANTDELIRESQRLRRQLDITTTSLDKFTQRLNIAIAEKVNDESE